MDRWDRPYDLGISILHSGIESMVVSLLKMDKLQLAYVSLLEGLCINLYLLKFETGCDFKACSNMSKNLSE